VKSAHIGRVFQRHAFDRLEILGQRIKVQHIVARVEMEMRVEYLVGEPVLHHRSQQPSVVVVGHAAAVMHLAQHVSENSARRAAQLRGRYPGVSLPISREHSSKTLAAPRRPLIKCPPIEKVRRSRQIRYGLKRTTRFSCTRYCDASADYRLHGF